MSDFEDIFDGGKEPPKPKCKQCKKRERSAISRERATFLNGLVWDKALRSSSADRKAVDLVREQGRRVKDATCGSLCLPCVDALESWIRTT